VDLKFKSIEGLRGWMAWWVVAGHAMRLTGTAQWLPAPVAKVVMKTDIAVNVFIIVSGFVITHLLMNARESYSQYIWRRFLRIAPIYIFCLFLAIAVTDWYVHVFVELPWSVRQGMRVDRLAETGEHWWSHLLAHLTLLHGLIPASVLKYSPSAFLAPAWSLSLEWQFYLLAPVIVGAMMRSLRSACITLAILLAGGVASRIVFAGQYEFPSMLLLSIQYFMVGIVSRLVLSRLRPLPVSATLLLLAVCPLVAYTRSLEMGLWALFAIFILQESGLLAPSSRGFALLQYAVGTNPVIRNLGTFSYSTYLIHLPIIAIVVHFYDAWRPIQQQMDIVIATALALVIVLIVSPLTYYLVEKPFIDMGKKKKAARADDAHIASTVSTRAP
jgi:peptidoglycan/LPS O-acetylase OafA/YrhL